MPSSPYQQALLDLLHDPPVRRDPAWYAEVDWDRLLAYAGVSLAPLVLRGIGGDPAIAPRTVLDTLVAHRDLLARKRLLVASVLTQACRALDGAAVRFLVLKGAAFAMLVYPDPVLRPMSDIDLWVAPERIGDALRALAAEGFRDSAQSELQAPASRDTDEWRLVRRGAPLEIELHTRLPSLAGLSWAAFATAWDAGDEADLGGIRARVLRPEHQLTHACLHLARRNLFTTGLSHLVDVTRIVGRWEGRWDWSALRRSWREEGITEWMLLALALARDLLGAAVPPDLAPDPVDADWQAMRALAEEQLWEGRAYRLPAALKRTARLRSPGEALRWLRWRLFDHYWRSPESRPAGRVVRDGLRRLWHDLTVKTPTYVRGWVRGDLRGPALAEGRALERRRAELERLVARRTAGPSDVATGLEGR